MSAYRFMKKQQETISAASALLKASDSELLVKLARNIEDRKKFEKEIGRAKGPGVSGKDLLKEISEVNGVRVIAKKVDAGSLEELRNISDAIKNGIGSGVAAVGSVVDEKPVILVSVTKELSKKINAGIIAKGLSAVMGGGGGGRPDFAQAGGKNKEKLDEAINSVVSMVAGFTG